MPGELRSASIRPKMSTPSWRASRSSDRSLLGGGARQDRAVGRRGTSNKEIAARLYTTPQTACKWRKRFYEEGLGGLEDRPRSGRPPRSEEEVKALACELPATYGVPLSRWSAAEVAREAIDRGLVAEISGTTVWRWLSEDAIRPYYHRSWIFPRDPDFAEKASRCWTSTRVGGKARPLEREST